MAPPATLAPLVQLAQDERRCPCLRNWMGERCQIKFENEQDPAALESHITRHITRNHADELKVLEELAQQLAPVRPTESNHGCPLCPRSWRAKLEDLEEHMLEEHMLEEHMLEEHITGLQAAEVLLLRRLPDGPDSRSQVLLQVAQAAQRALELRAACGPEDGRGKVQCSECKQKCAAGNMLRHILEQHSAPLKLARQEQQRPVPEQLQPEPLPDSYEPHQMLRPKAGSLRIASWNVEKLTWRVSDELAGAASSTTKQTLKLNLVADTVLASGAQLVALQEVAGGRGREAVMPRLVGLLRRKCEALGRPGERPPPPLLHRRLPTSRPLGSTA
jgi:hypothetical protein